MRITWLLLLSACATLDPGFELDQGTVCVSGAYASDGTWPVRVESCYSSSYRDVELECLVVVESSQIVVTSELAFETPRNPRDDCRSLAVVCSLPDLRAGTYTVSYAGDEAVVVVSATEPSGEVCLPRLTGPA